MKIEIISIEDYADIRPALVDLEEKDLGLVNVVTGWHPTSGFTLFFVGVSSKVVMGASEVGGESTEFFTSSHGNQPSFDSRRYRESAWRNFQKFNFWSKSL